MKKLFPLVLLLVLSCTLSFAQDTPVKRTEEYCELRIINTSLLSYKFVVHVDYGDSPQDLQDKNGKRMEFRSAVAALNYMNGMGWELRDIRTVVDDGDSHSRYIMSRKL